MFDSICPYNPFDPDTVENPAKFFDWLRENQPVYGLPNGAYHLVSRFSDVKSVAMDTETYSSNLIAVLQADVDSSEAQLLDFSEGGQKATDVLAIADPPQHARQRQLSNRAFTRRRIEAMRPDIEAIAKKFVGQASQRRLKVDWISTVAVPVPMLIIVRLLGLPEDDLAKLKQWSDSSVRLLSGVNSEQQLIACGEDIAAMFAYLGEYLAKALLSPQDNVIGDLLRESELNRDFGIGEIVSILVQLLTAGNETTTSLIGSAMMALLNTPGMQQQLRNRPQDIANFVEEVLRLESPFHGHFRVTTRDCELAGVALKKGQRLMLLWSSANRDEAVFDNADSIDLKRVKPRAHLAFGHGIHQCIGAALARMEAQAVLEAVLQQTRLIRLAKGNDFSHVPSLFIRSLCRLDVEFDSL